MSKYNCSCRTTPSKVSSDNVYYNGAYLSTLDIMPNELLTSIIEKINTFNENTNGCVSCDGGIPVFAGLKNSFALSTDSNGKVQTATNIYTKTEVDGLVGQVNPTLQQVLTNGNQANGSIQLNSSTFSSLFNSFGINFTATSPNYIAGMQSPVGNLYFGSNAVTNGNNIYFTSPVSAIEGTQPNSLTTLSQVQLYVTTQVNNIPKPKETYYLPKFITINAQTNYTFTQLINSELLMIIVESNPLDISTEVSFNQTTGQLTLPSYYAVDGLRVFIIYKK